MEEKKGKRWNACWPDETDLTALKSLAHTFLYLEIQPTKMSPLVVKHPFTDSGITVIRDKNNSIQPADLLNDPRALDCWRGQMAQNIQEAESSNQLFYMVTKSYRLAFLKHTAGYLRKRCGLGAELRLDHQRGPQQRSQPEPTGTAGPVPVSLPLSADG